MLMELLERKTTFTGSQERREVLLWGLPKKTRVNTNDSVHVDKVGAGKTTFRWFAESLERQLRQANEWCIKRECIQACWKDHRRDEQLTQNN